MGKEAKTNAMRILEREKVPYTAHEYAHEEGVAVDGVTVAASMGEDPACVYKTLVTQGASKNYFVFVIPVAAELDLKAAARSVGEKSVAMIHVADINKVTGYVRGGCSPVGMKKQYKTVFDESVLTQQKVYVSGGTCGAVWGRICVCGCSCRVLGRNVHIQHEDFGLVTGRCRWAVPPGTPNHPR